METGAQFEFKRSGIPFDNAGEFSATIVAFQAVIEALQKEGLIPKRAKQRLDSTHVLSAVRDMSALECVRETLRLGLEGRGFGSSVSLPYPILLSDSFICGLF